MVSAMEDDKTSFWEPCWACRVINGEPCGFIVAETRDVLVLINPFALADGHALVVPRKHIENLYGLPDDLAGPILSTAARVARASKRAFAAGGVTLRQNNEAASDQHLFHFHLHVIPRFNGDLERFNSEPVLSEPYEQAEMAKALRAAMLEQENNSL
jgi:histidine triad (HIT) family protein